MKAQFVIFTVCGMLLFHSNITAQELLISVHNGEVDSTWHYDTDFQSNPERLSCKDEGIYHLRARITGYRISEEDADSITLHSDKPYISSEKEAELENKMNSEKKKELEEKNENELNQDFAKDDIQNVAEEEVWDAIMKNWNTGDYFICLEDCPSDLEECLVTYKVIELQETEVYYKYRSGYTRSSRNIDGGYDVTVFYDLVIEYKALVYFSVWCFCEDGDVMMSTEPSLLADLDLTTPQMKPGYPFDVPVVIRPFPWIPVGVGVVGGGVITYLLIDKESDGEDCTFTASIESTPSICGNPNGSATVAASPPDAYSYAWSNGAATPTNQNLEAGTYAVTITRDGTDCNRVLTATVGNTNPAFTVTSDTQDAGCGINNGSAILQADPPGAYTFEWSNGLTGSSQTDLAPGTYMVSVSAGPLCMETIEIVIGEMPPDYSLSFETTPADCGDNNGSATVIVDPPGSYTFEWSDGSSGALAEDLGAGDYTVTVTNEGGCSSIASATVEENEASYMNNVSTTAGNCLGEGADIIIDLVTPGSGPMQILATGPDGLHEISVPPGVVNLASHFTVLPGDWQIIVRDAGLPARCEDETSAGVDDNSEPLLAVDDNYQTSTDQPVSGNVLDNDSGLNLEVAGNTEPTGGSVVINQDGSFTYTPPIGESGEFTFQYTVMDACGNTLTSTVTIQVSSIACTFEATFSTIPAHCGLSDGMITTSLMPPGEYMFVWSDGNTTQDLSNIPGGAYSVTITSVDQNCDKIFNVSVMEEPNTYITEIMTQPGNCSGEGEISIILETPGAGPLVVVLEGPGGMTELTLPPGQHDLSAIVNIPAGDYTITVYDEGIGQDCSELQFAVVEDNTPDLVPQDDFYETPFQTPVEGNVLDNDNGLGLVVLEVSDVVGGQVDFNPDGAFTFTPEGGFSGTASFTYTVQDACGGVGMGFVEIIVAEGVCDFIADFQTSSASCGLEDGSASVFVDPPGNYIYTWSNGESGTLITNVPAGMYSVTIEDIDQDCFLVFGTEIGEEPAMFIHNIEVVQPICPISGDIIFNLASPGPGPYTVEVAHPNGIEVFELPEGQVFLSDLIEIIDGNYVVTVTEAAAGADCIDSFEATITGTTNIEIALEGVVPPSEPTAMDGAIIVVVTMPGTPPYTIALDGDVVGMTSDEFFTIEGVGAGSYTVQIEDVNGCLSNVLEVDVPIPPENEPMVELGFGILTTDVPQTRRPEMPGTSSRDIFTTGIHASVHYYMGEVKMTSRALFSRGSAGSYLQFGHWTDIINEDILGFDLHSRAGFIINHFGEQVKPYLSLDTGISRDIGKQKHIRLEGTMRIKAREEVDRPEWGLTVHIPVVLP